MTDEPTRTTETHPLRTRGRARALYAGAMSTDVVAVLVLALVVSGLVRAPFPVQAASVAAAVGLQIVARRLRTRAWWHVPLRAAGPVPTVADLALWSATAAVLVVVAAVQAVRLGSAWSFGAWFLVGTAVVAAWMPSADRPDQEPPSAWWPRAVPMLGAATVVLVLAVAAQQASAGAAALVATVVLGVTVLLRRLAARVRPCAPS